MTLFYGAAHALISHQGRYLVTRRCAEDDYMPLKWDIPGGSVDPGESLEEALIREVEEETKIEIKIQKALYAYTNRATLPDRQTFQVVYLCSYVGGDVQLDAAAHDLHRWALKSEIQQLDAIGFLAGLRENIAFFELE